MGISRLVKVTYDEICEIVDTILFYFDSCLDCAFNHIIEMDKPVLSR